MTEFPTPQPVMQRLVERLNQAARTQRGVWLGEQLGLAVVVILPLFAAAMAIDALVALPGPVRWLVFLVAIASGGFIAYRAWRLMQQDLSPAQMAVRVERAAPGLDNVVINALLLSGQADDVGYDPSLVAALVQQGDHDLSGVDMSSAVPKRRLMTLSGAGAAILLTLVACAIANPERFFNALARVAAPFAGSDRVTRTTIVKITPGETDVLVGAAIDIEATVGGSLPDNAQVIVKPAQGQTQYLAMDSKRLAAAFGGGVQAAAVTDGGGTDGEPTDLFRGRIDAVAQDLQYRIVAGDAESDWLNVKAHRRPTLTSIIADVTAPSYTGEPGGSQAGGIIRGLAGSTVTWRAVASKSLAAATFDTASLEGASIDITGESGDQLQVAFPLTSAGTYQIKLVDQFGFSNEPATYAIELLPDASPVIEITQPVADVAVEAGAVVQLRLKVTDNFGLAKIELIERPVPATVRSDSPDQSDQRESDADTTPVADADPAVTARATADRILEAWSPDAGDRSVREQAIFFELPVERLRLTPGSRTTLFIRASDFNDVTGPGVSQSRVIGVSMLKPIDAAEQKRQRAREVAANLTKLIQKQRQALTMTGSWRNETPLSSSRMSDAHRQTLRRVVTLQEELRTETATLVGMFEESEPLRTTLAGLYENQMVEAISLLRQVAGAGNAITAMDDAMKSQSEILAALTGRADRLEQDSAAKAIRDVLAALDRLIKSQRSLRDTTSQTDLSNDEDQAERLADRQDALAEQVHPTALMFEAYAREVAQSDRDASLRYVEAGAAIESKKIRSHMILAASRLADANVSSAVEMQDQVIADLESIAALLRDPVARAAEEKLDKAREAFDEAKDDLNEMEKLAQKVKQLSEELEKSRDESGNMPAEASAMEESIEEAEDRIKELAEKMAKDLSLFPEIPLANEMVQEMREVFEDVEQAEGSETSKKIEEVAVDRDDGVLNATATFKERIADQEQWLLNKPDSTRTLQEGVDVGEIPAIPLVDLPAELEDIVGELLEEQEELDDLAADSSSNAILPDLPAGWDIADGPMPSFGAKGKSGNEKPNKMEQTGRSGAGRQGMSNGELAENFAKDLEGSEVDVRRTNDPFGEGYVEEENPNSEAKATGGGKMSGMGGEGGLTGTAPPRDELALRQMARRQAALRRNAEAVYSKATLMYLPTGELEQAILLMRQAERSGFTGNERQFAETVQRVTHALKNTQRMIDGKPAIDLDPRVKLPDTIREQIIESADESIPAEFEGMVADYYKAIAAGAVK